MVLSSAIVEEAPEKMASRLTADLQRMFFHSDLGNSRDHKVCLISAVWLRTIVRERSRLGERGTGEICSARLRAYNDSSHLGRFRLSSSSGVGLRDLTEVAR